MSNRDDRLRGGKKLGVLGARISRTDRVGGSDREDLYRFSLSQSSRLDLGLTQIGAGRSRLELYLLKRPLAQVLRQIGDLAFGQLRRRDRAANLKLITPAQLNGSQQPGLYLVRVVQSGPNSQSEATSRYRLQVAAAAGIDRVNPTASLSATNLSAAGGPSYDFTVTYQDDVGVDISSISNSNVLVQGPNGFSQLATRVAVSDASNGPLRSVTYRITAPGGSWDGSDNGSYSLTLQSNQVRDTSGNFAATGLLGSFQVAISPTPSLDREAPTANLLSINPNTRDLTIVYRDNVAINSATIDDNDLQVTGPGGTALVTRVIANDSSGNTRTVTYRIQPPGGGWDNADNGSYRIALQANQVSDSSGNFAPSQVLGSLEVNIPVRVGNRYSVTGSDETAIRAQFNLFSTAPDGNPIADQASSSTIGLFTGAVGNFVSGAGRLTSLLNPNVASFTPDNQVVASTLNLRADLLNYNPTAQTGTIEYRLFREPVDQFRPGVDPTLFGTRFNFSASFLTNFNLDQAINSLDYIVTKNLLGDGGGSGKPSGLGFSDNPTLDSRDVTGGTVRNPAS